MPPELKSETINRLKAEIKAKGKEVPSLEDLKLDDQIALLQDVLTEADDKAASKGAELKDEPSGEDIKAVMQMVKDMREEQARMKRDGEAKDKQIELLAKAVQEKAIASSPTGSVVNDPQFRELMRNLMNKDTNERGLVRLQYVDESDRCAPVTFFTNKLHQKIWHVDIGGQHVAPPLNEPFIRFHNLFHFKDQHTGRVITRGEYTTESTTMVEYLRKSNKYGVEIFETAEEVAQLSDNSTWADLRDKHLAILKLKLDSDVDKLAYKYKIPIGKGADYMVIRKKVAEELANEDQVRMEAGRQQQAKEREASELLIKQFASGAPVGV